MNLQVAGPRARRDALTAMAQDSTGVKRQNMGVPEKRGGTLFWGPCNKDPTI